MLYLLRALPVAFNSVILVGYRDMAKVLLAVPDHGRRHVLPCVRCYSRLASTAAPFSGVVHGHGPASHRQVE